MAISTGHHCHLQVLTIFPLLRDQTVCNDGQDLFLWVMCGGWECRMQTKPKHRALLPSVKKLNILASYVQTTSAHKPVPRRHLLRAPPLTSPERAPSERPFWGVRSRFGIRPPW